MPRSIPYDGLESLAAIDVPVLVVASHDEADPGHPHETASRIAAAIGGAELLREVPRSIPYEGLESLAGIDVPVLVVASHDEADPGHPHETASRIAEAIGGAELVSEEKGESPLAWQGGKLSREIERFARDRVNGMEAG